MINSWAAAVAIAAICLSFGTAQARCQLQGTGVLDLSQNSHVHVYTNTDHEGCRISYALDLSGYNPLLARTVLEKAEIMKLPSNGKLMRDGTFVFLYTPNPNFLGKDNFVIYLCGSNLAGKGCARLNYDVTVR